MNGGGAIGLLLPARPTLSHSVLAPRPIGMMGIGRTNTIRSVPAPVLEARRTAARAPLEEVTIQPVQSRELLDQLSEERRAVYASLGVELRDGALDAQRRFGTTVGLFVNGRLAGAFSAWRMSEALLSLGHLVAAVGIQKYPPDKVVELASMFVVPEHAGKGHVRRLFEAGRILIAGMRPDLLVAFAVRSVADRYIQRYGFRPVGDFTPHPLAPTVDVIPLVATFDDFARAHFA